jgi:serine protease Do
MNEYELNGFEQDRMRNDEPEKAALSDERFAPTMPPESVNETAAEPVNETAAEPVNETVTEPVQEAPAGAEQEAGARPEAEAAPESAQERQIPQAPVFDPEYKAPPVSPSEPEYQRHATEPSFQDYYYASGPMRTARPAQNENSQPGSQSYGAQSYGGQSYGGQSYGGQSYGAQRYGEPYYTQRSSAPATPPVHPAQTPKKKRSGFWKKAVAAALAVVLLGGGAGMGGAALMNHLQKNGSSDSSTNVQVAVPRETKDLNIVTVDSGKLMTAPQVYKSNVNSTVGITTEVTTNYWGFQSTGAAAGSGFILTEDGYILTNEHVIEDANSITVAMYDGTSYPARVVGYDASNDIAVLKIDATGLTPVTLGNSDALEVGDEVVAIGNPLGELTFSLTKGNVSALNRAVTLSSNVTMNLIQTDAAINSGNSGGALFNMYGEVVGITNAKYSSSGYSSSASIDNIGFAIPINSVRNIVTSIIEKGYISTPYIGVTVGNVSQESQDYGMPKGAAIRSVEKDSPAEKAGLQSNDIVTAVDGETISSYEELGKLISESQVGDELKLTVYRKGETLELTVSVGERIQDAIPQSSSQSSSGYSGGMPWYPENP